MICIGSLYSGLAGLDAACELALGGQTVWQLDQVGAPVRRRHWPDALQVEADVATVDPLDLPRIDVLCGGFACQDLSCTGKQAGLLEGDRTGPTYRGLIRFASVLQPEIVVMENVPALLSRWRTVLEEDWHRLGYTLTWVKARALDAGHPHLRARVFVVAQRGGCGGGVLDAPRDRMWTPERGERVWATPVGGDAVAGPRPTDARRGPSPGLVAQVRTWATPKSVDAKSPGGSSGDGARQGSDGLACQVRPWPTPQEADGLRGSANMFRGEGNPTLPGAVRPWPTPMAGSTAPNGHGGSNRLLPDAVRPWPTAMGADADDVKVQGIRGTEPGPSLNYEARQRPFGSRLNPDWSEALMGLPPGWTLPEGPRLHIDPKAPAVRGRYPADWDRSVYWPGFAWEPCRTIPDGPPCPGRPARIRAVGNAVDPQQGALAIRTAMQPRQGRLL